MAKHSPLYALIQFEHPFLANTFWSTLAQLWSAQEHNKPNKGIRLPSTRAYEHKLAKKKKKTGAEGRWFKERWETEKRV